MPGGCANGAGNQLVFSATANTTYYFLVAASCGAGNLVFSITALQPPGNDNFADATAIPALAFSDTVDTTAATREPGEPGPQCQSYTGTVWYAFTPTETASIMTTTEYPSVVASPPVRVSS